MKLWSITFEYRRREQENNEPDERAAKAMHAVFCSSKEGRGEGQEQKGLACRPEECEQREERLLRQEDDEEDDPREYPQRKVREER